MHTIVPLASLCSILFLAGQWMNAAMCFLAMAVEFISQVEED